jgi:hypothetical protein
MDLGKAKEGRYLAKYVPKNKTPHLAAWECMERVVRLPGARLLFGFMENGYGKAYYPAEFHGGTPLETMKRLRAEWERRGRKEWERTGWPIEKEKAAKCGHLEIANRLELELGSEWGEVFRGWIARGRSFPHPWGVGMRAWARERRRAEALEGFEV